MHQCSSRKETFAPRQRLRLDVTGTQVTERHHALTSVAELLRNGRIIVLKGLGGFQLLVDARHEAAVPRLRERKQRPAKRYSI